MSLTNTVNDLKASLAKLLPCETPEATEQARDLLQRLDDCDITFQVLSDTLVGTVVSKYKPHNQLGNMAKQLVKKWKKLAKQSAAAAPPVARLDSTASASSEVIKSEIQEWSDLPPVRQKMCDKLHSTLELSKPDLTELNADAVSELCVSRSSEVESAIQTKFPNNPHSYVDKARSLCFNLTKNSLLREQVLLGRVSATQLVNMTSEELAPREEAQARAAQVARLRDSRRLDWEQANEGKINEMCGIKGDLLSASLFTCGRCKSTKTTSTQKQTRSADEPMTVFVLCMNCGKRWKC